MRDKRFPLLRWSHYLKVAPLVSLSESCSEVVQELVEKLSRIGVDNNFKRAGLVAEFKAVWRRREI